MEAIKQLKARYERAADTKDLDLLRTTVTDDFFCDTGGSGASATTGIEPFLDRLRANPDVIAVHHAVLPEIELTSPSTATGIWAVHVMVRTPDGKGMDGYGHYHDTYVKVDGSWLVSSLQLKWLHVQPH